MAVTDYDTYKSLRNNAVVSMFSKTVVGDVGPLQSSWIQAPFAGATPTTAAACSQSTTGAITWERLGLNAAPTKTRRIAYLQASQLNANTAGRSTAVLIDRLSHQGGIVANVTGAQTTNLPTAALTRYTSGEGVFAALEVYTQIGSTGSTVQVEYTNQAGTPGQVSPVFRIGGAGFRAVGTMLIVPLADGDTGVRSVENVNFLSTTGTAGNVGVTLFKILDWVPRAEATTFNMAEAAGYDAFIGGGGLCPVVDNNACLQLCLYSVATTGVNGVMMKFIEDDA